MTLEQAMWRYPLLLRHTSDIVLFLQADGRIIDANEAAALAYGYPVSDLCRRALHDLSYDDPAALLRVTAESDGRELEAMHKRQDGTRFPVSMRLHHIKADGVDEYLAIIQDVSEEKRTATTYRLLHEIDRWILQRPHVESILQFICDQLVEAFGYPLVWIGLKDTDEAVTVWARAGEGANYLNAYSVRIDDSPEGQGPIGRAVRSQQRQIGEFASDPGLIHYRAQAEAEGLRSMIALPLCAHDSVLGVMAVYAATAHAFDRATVEHLTSFADQIALSLAAANHQVEMHRMAFRDPLTDLPNRRILDARLEALIESKTVRGALLLLDIDNFKVITDTAGHAAGDRFLVDLARLLSSTLRPGDLLVRMAGDQFAVLLEEISLPAAEALGNRLRQAVGDFRFSDGSHNFSMSLSIGCALVDGELPAEAVLDLAGSALITAKELGRDRVVLFQKESDQSALLAEASHWAARIKDCLRDGGFELVFQPVVRLSDGVADHYETLLRMRDADGRYVPPGKFLPAAERFGMMPQIDRWVVAQAYATLQRHPKLKLFVNLAGASLRDDSLLTFIETRMQEGELQPGRLTFEITETTAVTNLEDAHRWMKRMGELGCGFALDDFGIGFSSFAYLRSLPADYVKIDGSFIRNVNATEPDRALVQAMCQIAHTLGKQVVAEWVEGEEIASVLRELGVEHGQGYHFGKPAFLREILSKAELDAALPPPESLN